jgi:hypothetical protein
MLVSSNARRINVDKSLPRGPSGKTTEKIALAQEPERISRFQREAEALASLNHPNIAAI